MNLLDKVLRRRLRLRMLRDLMARVRRIPPELRTIIMRYRFEELFPNFGGGWYVGALDVHEDWAYPGLLLTVFVGTTTYRFRKEHHSDFYGPFTAIVVQRDPSKTPAFLCRNS